MKRPSFQFYPGDWRSDSALRRCTEAARGAWMDILCVLHDSNEYGVCRWPLKDLQRASGVSAQSIRELVSVGVLKGSDSTVPEFVFTPRHGRVLGDPVTLIQPGPGPCWYSARMVRDEHVRLRKGDPTRFPKPTMSAGTEENKSAPNPSPMPPFGEGLGDGSSTSSSSSASTTPSAPRGKKLDGFDEFWSEYPRKDKRQRAEKAWNRLKPSPEIRARILADIQKRSTSHDWTKESGRFIPHPTTYLNDKGWEDLGVTLPGLSGAVGTEDDLEGDYRRSLR